MTFRVRTAIVVLALTAVTMGGAFAGVWQYFMSAQRAQLDDALLAIARTEADDVANGHLEFTDAPGPSANAVGPLPKFGVLYEEESGRALTSTANFTTIPVLPRGVTSEVGFDFNHDGSPMRGVIVAAGRPTTKYRLLLATSRLDFEEDARILARAMTIAFVVGFLWATIVAFGVATRLTREHGIVGDVARRVASGDTSARISFQLRDADLRQLADDLNAMIERLVGLLAVQERFIAHAAHELRTPLTSLRIEIEHALRPGAGQVDYELALRESLDSARRLSDLAEDLLQLARVKAEANRNKGAPVASSSSSTLLSEAIGDAITAIGQIGKARGVTIVNESNDEGRGTSPTMVRGDQRGLARVFRNVLENAVQFSPNGGTVTIHAPTSPGDDDDDGQTLRIGIVDEGPGIAKEDVERIFEPFARGGGRQEPVVASGTGTGTGLGLAIARDLARAFDGDITVDAGSGGRFYVHLRVM